MRCLVVEDDFGSRRFLQLFLRRYFQCDVVVDGQEAVDAVRLAWEEHDPYGVIFMDIMMPNLDGHGALKEIRAYEKAIGVHEADASKVVVLTALGDPRNVVEAYFHGAADAYLVKPAEPDQILETLKEVGIVVE